MEDSPLRKVSHERRLEIGQRICARILETFKESTLAIFITGSTAKALDRPFSDLEMTAIVKDSVEVPTKYYVYDGLLIQIDYRQESEFLKAAREPGRDWPLGADECRNRIVLFERDGWTKRLVEAVKENDAKDFTDAIRFAALGMTESLAAVRNADFKNDLVDLRTRAFYMAWDTARVVYLLNRKYVLTTSWYWKQLFECPEQPRDLRQLVEIVAGFVNSSRQELVQAAERLWKDTMLFVTRRGVSIESSEILV
jgi:hypothetical protein